MRRGSHLDRNLSVFALILIEMTSLSLYSKPICKLLRLAPLKRLRDFQSSSARSLSNCFPQTKTYSTTCTTKCSTICAMTKKENRLSSPKWLSLKLASTLSHSSNWKTPLKCCKDRPSCDTKCTTRHLHRQTATLTIIWRLRHSTTSEFTSKTWLCCLHLTLRQRLLAWGWRKLGNSSWIGNRNLWRLHCNRLTSLVHPYCCSRIKTGRS